jgi:2-iminobutanoate/2-iminopropanoate deaminase
MRIFYTDQAQYPPFSAARGPRFRDAFPDGAFPATTGVVTGPLPGAPGIEIELMASRPRRSANSDRVYRTFPGTLSPPAFAHLTESSDLVVLSGQTGFDLAGATISHDPREQTLATLDNLRAVLEDSGLDPSAILKLTVYVTDPSFYAGALEDVTAFAAEGGRPSALMPTLVVVDELFKPGVFVEIEAVASRLPEESTPWLFATGRSSAAPRPPGDLDSSVDEALGRVSHELSRAALPVSDALSCTVWVATPQTVVGVRERVTSYLASVGVPVTIVPMQRHEHDGGGVLVEIVARRRTG